MDIIKLSPATEFKPYDDSYCSEATVSEWKAMKEDLKKNGQRTPILITKTEESKWLIVDGYTRYKIIKELYDNGEWFKNADGTPRDIECKIIDAVEALSYFISAAFARKDYTKMQRAMFGAKHLWNNTQVSVQTQRANKTTQEEVAKLVGSNREYTQATRTLLDKEPKAYELIFTLGVPLNIAEVKDLTNRLANKPDLVDTLIFEYKEAMKNEKYKDGKELKKSFYRNIANPDQVKEKHHLQADEFSLKGEFSKPTDKKTLILYTDEELAPTIKNTIKEALQDDFNVEFKLRFENSQEADTAELQAEAA